MSCEFSIIVAETFTVKLRGPVYQRRNTDHGGKGHGNPSNTPYHGVCFTPYRGNGLQNCLDSSPQSSCGLAFDPSD